MVPGRLSVSENLQNAALEVEGLLGEQRGRVVARLHQRFEQTHVAAGVGRSLAQHAEKQLRRQLLEDIDVPWIEDE